MAAANGHVYVLQALLAAGAYIEARDKFVVFCFCHGSTSHASCRWQRTPVVLAAANGHADVVLSLIQERAAIDVKDK
jgi:ankyrin repeat protein